MIDDIQITGSDDYGKLCCFIDNDGNRVYGHLALFMKAVSDNPMEKDIYMRREDNKQYRLAWKVSPEEVKENNE